MSYQFTVVRSSYVPDDGRIGEPRIAITDSKKTGHVDFVCSNKDKQTPRFQRFPSLWGAEEVDGPSQKAYHLGDGQGVR
jgi:hypothetical protein